MIEDIVLVVLNAKHALMDVRLLRYLEHNFNEFEKSIFFLTTPNCFTYPLIHLFLKVRFILTSIISVELIRFSDTDTAPRIDTNTNTWLMVLTDTDRIRG